MQEAPMIIPALKLSGVGKPRAEHEAENALAEAIRMLPRVYHADGAFLGRDGRRFDLTFKDLQNDPTLSARCFPGVGEIERALEVRFVRRPGRHRCSVWNWDAYT